MTVHLLFISPSVGRGRVLSSVGVAFLRQVRSAFLAIRLVSGLFRFALFFFFFCPLPRVVSCWGWTRASEETCIYFQPTHCCATMRASQGVVSFIHIALVSSYMSCTYSHSSVARERKTSNIRGKQRQTWEKKCSTFLYTHFLPPVTLISGTGSLLGPRQAPIPSVSPYSRHGESFILRALFCN